MKNLRTHIEEAVSHGKTNSYNAERLKVGNLSEYKDFEERLSTSTSYSWDISKDYIDAIDRTKPLGLPENINFSGYWMDTQESKVTGNKRIWMFIDLWSYIVLDFDKYDELVSVEKRGTSSGKLLTKDATDKLLKKIEYELNK